MTSAASHLLEIAEELQKMEQRYESSNKYLPPSLSSADRELFQILVDEGMELLEELEGRESALLKRTRVLLAGGKHSGFMPFPSEATLNAVRTVFGGVASKMLRREVRQLNPPVHPVKDDYVAPRRIEELRELSGASWDTTRLVRLAEELNLAHGNDMHMATVMLVRAITDHVPPPLGMKKFAEVVANHSAGTPQGRSFKGSMQHLENSMRNIADSHLHVPMRSKETLPTEQQVDFRQDLDVLLSEVVRVLSKRS